MTQEEKDLLLKDLCARLPYEVKCQVQEDEFTYIGTLCRLEVNSKNGNLLDFAESMSGLDCQVYLSEVKPYLFPLSSMTEEQKTSHNFLKHSAYASPTKLVDWYIKNHFDYRGLIPMGLAKDATGKNIY